MLASHLEIVKVSHHDGHLGTLGSLSKKTEVLQEGRCVVEASGSLLFGETTAMLLRELGHLLVVVVLLVH